MTKEETDAEVMAVMGCSDPWSPTDSPGTVEALMVATTVPRSLVIPHKQAPEVMLKALARLNPRA